MGWTTPPTRLVGDPITVSDFNASVRDNTNYLYGDTAWTTVIAFTNGWSAGGATPQYRRTGSLVLLRGIVTGGTTNMSAFIMPAAYTPAYQQTFAVVGSSAAVMCLATMNAAYGVTPALVGGSVGIFLDGIAYSTL